jgi:hypothetical protein
VALRRVIEDEVRNRLAKYSNRKRVIDITRLGLMVVFGQPKTSAEYIQATSRMGRDPTLPGLIVTYTTFTGPATGPTMSDLRPIMNRSTGALKQPVSRLFHQGRSTRGFAWTANRLAATRSKKTPACAKLFSRFSPVYNQEHPFLQPGRDFLSNAANIIAIVFRVFTVSGKPLPRSGSNSLFISTLGGK